VVVQLSNGRVYSTQAYNADNPVVINKFQLDVRARFSEMHKQVPRPWQFIVLRVLNVSFMRLSLFREWVKRALVKMLITGQATISGCNHRVIVLGEQISISDRLQDTPPSLSLLETRVPFSAIHMASQGNWQIQDDQGTE
jgi:hypothetical protein